MVFIVVRDVIHLTFIVIGGSIDPIDKENLPDSITDVSLHHLPVLRHVVGVISDLGCGFSWRLHFGGADLCSRLVHGFWPSHTCWRYKRKHV